MRHILRIRPLRLVFTANVISMMGSGMNSAAVMWFVLQATHSEVALGMLVVLQTIPSMLMLPFSGVIIDREDRRHLVMLLDAGRALIILTVAVLALTGRVQVWHLYLMNTLVQTGFWMFWPTINALIQELTPPDQYVHSNTFLMAGIQGGFLVSGAVVGFVYNHIHLGGVLLIDVCTYVVSLSCYSRGTQGASRRPAAGCCATRRRGSGGALPARDARGHPLFAASARRVAGGLQYGAVPGRDDVVSGGDGAAQRPHPARRRGRVRMDLRRVGHGGIPERAVRARPDRPRGSTARVADRDGDADDRHAGHFFFPRSGGCRSHLHDHGLGARTGRNRHLQQHDAMVPKHFMGRVQNTFYFAGTGLQIVLAFSAGMIAHRVSLTAAFALLGIVYALAFISSVWPVPAASERIRNRGRSGRGG